MKCPKCNGRGTVGYYHIDHFVDIECDRCNGSGEVSEVPMTNEEYLRSLNTEQLAEWIGNVLDEVCDTSNYNCKNCFKWCNRNKVEKWLKQPHTNE